MRTKDYSFELPEELIAQFPPEERGTARLMVVDRGTGTIHHSSVRELPELIPPGSVMVVNNSRVRKARLFAETVAGGTVEILLVEAETPTRWLAMVSRSKRQKVGRVYLLPSGVRATLAADAPPYRVLEMSEPVTDDYLETHGHVPLPPYIKRADAGLDAERYQTVYADSVGSVAAPTAGLHLTEAIMDNLKRHGVEINTVTLHVGIGTFLPIRTPTIEDHTMHREAYTVPAATAEQVTLAKREGRPVVAVGTTTVRTLESAWEGAAGAESAQAGVGKAEAAESAQAAAANGGRLRAGLGETDLYIRPGYRFKAVDWMFTNFHTPESTLLVMVGAFAGYDVVMNAYRKAVAERYRFFSYGDAMLIR